MTARLLFALLAAFLTVGVCAAQQAPVKRILKPSLSTDGAEGFEELVSRGYSPLFNGKDLTGWRNPYPFGEASVVDGEIHLLANKKFFITQRLY